MSPIKTTRLFPVLIALLLIEVLSSCAAEPVQNEKAEADQEIELSSLPVSEVEAVFVYSIAGTEAQLSGEEKAEIIEALRPVEFSGTGTMEYAEYDGLFPLMFRLELADGSIIHFAVSPPFYIIDSLGYTAEEKVCRSIDKMYWKLVEKYFPENLRWPPH